MAFLISPVLSCILTVGRLILCKSLWVFLCPYILEFSLNDCALGELIFDLCVSVDTGGTL